MNLSFDDYLRLTELFLIFVSLILVIFGWIIPYKHSIQLERSHQKFNKKMILAKWEKDLVDKQISELYGPIAELLREQELRRSLIKQQFGRHEIFSSNQLKITDLSENEQLIWKHFVETYIIPIHLRVLEIIQKNQHLVLDSKFPSCFRDYMEYVIGWELLDNQLKSGIPNHYNYYYSYNYPIEFNIYIEDTLIRLLNKQNNLLGVD